VAEDRDKAIAKRKAAAFKPVLEFFNELAHVKVSHRSKEECTLREMMRRVSETELWFSSSEASHVIFLVAVYDCKANCVSLQADNRVVTVEEAKGLIVKQVANLIEKSNTSI